MDNLQKESLLKSLRKNEAIIKSGIEQFINVGQALLDIRENKQYLALDYTSFDDYCAAVWPDLPSSTRYHGMNVAEIQRTIGEDDITPAYAIAIRRVTGPEDEDLILKTWNEVQNISKDTKITAALVSAVAKKEWLIKNSGPLGEAVKEMRVSVEKAYILQKTLLKLPDEYTIAVIRHGIGEDCVSGGTMDAIYALSFTYNTEAMEILTSGYMDDIPLWQLTESDIFRFKRRLEYDDAEYKILRAIEKQKEIAAHGNSRIFDSVGTWRIEEDGELLYFIFPNGSSSEIEVFNFIQEHGLKIFFISVYDPNNPPDINFGNGNSRKPNSVKVKPENLIAYIKNSTL